jgi:GT2 family glycosyltransferase
VSGGPVVAVVLAWNGREDTLACLDALARSEFRGLETVLVDNGSTDGTSDAVATAHPGVEILRSETNEGYAGGNNLGLARALARGARHVLVLNNDVEVAPDAVAALVDAAERLPAVGAVNPKILFADPPGRIWFAGATFDPRRGYNGRQRGYGEPDGPAFA